MMLSTHEADGTFIGWTEKHRHKDHPHTWLECGCRLCLIPGINDHKGDRQIAALTRFHDHIHRIQARRAKRRRLRGDGKVDPSNRMDFSWWHNAKRPHPYPAPSDVVSKFVGPKRARKAKGRVLTR